MIVPWLRAGLWAAVVLAGNQVVCGRERAGPPRPNVLVILADDLGFSDLGSYGGEIDTPNLDRLAAGGLRFTQGYNTARCWPTRAALLTGYYPQAIARDALPGGQGGGQGTRPGWATLLPQRLAAAGYRSYHSGKWHIDGDPRAQGFARSLDVHGVGQNNYFDAAAVTEDGKPLVAAADFYTTRAIGDHAVNCLAEHARDHAGTPFFHYVAFTAPHFPLQAPADAVATYRQRYLAGWDVVRGARAARLREAGIVTTPVASPDPEVGPPYQPQPETLARFGPGELDRPHPWDSLTPEEREFQATKMAIHAAMVDLMDREVGRIVAQLQAQGALDDTLIVVLSDNGASAEILIRGEGHDPTAAPGSRKTFLCLGPGWSTCANTPFRRHKTWVHEGGIATPWIVHWPKGIAARGELRHQPVHAIDLVPTVLELARVPDEEGQSAPPLHGRSFARALADPAAPPTHESLWWCHEGHRAVRMGDWKLVAVRGQAWELYDLASDRCETTNLAAAQPDRVAVLEREWNRIAATCRGLAPAETAAAKRPPNIVFFLCDDLGTGDVAALGGKHIQTPKIDALFARGTRLTRHWAGSAVCAPSRCVLLTGKHPGQAAVRSNREVKPEGQFPMPAGTVTLPLILRQAGYATGGFGKWGLGAPGSVSDPLAAGFERFYGYNCQREAHSYFPDHLWDDRKRLPLDNPARSGDPRVARGGTVPPERAGDEAAYARFTGQQYAADLIAREQLAFIRAHAGRPFFLYVPTTVPHVALQVPADEPSLAHYRRHFGEEAPYLGGSGYVPCQRPLATYAAMVTRMDREVGRIVGLLEELGLTDDTIIVFSSDNGATFPGCSGLDTARLASNGSLRGWKGSPYEGGLRVPTAIVWPGTIPAGKELTAPTGFEDWLPTLLDLAGLGDRIPAGGAGRSLAAPLRGTVAVPADRFLYRELTEGRWQAVTDGRWKAIRQALGPQQAERSRPTELYDVAADSSEAKDLAADHPDVVLRLEALMDREHVPDPAWPLPFADLAAGRARGRPTAAEPGRAPDRATPGAKP